MYKITIEETKNVLAMTGKQWAKVDTVEVERDDLLRGPDEPRTRIKEVYGYTPEVEKMVEVKREVLIQIVDDMDLAKVIKAINGLE